MTIKKSIKKVTSRLGLGALWKKKEKPRNVTPPRATTSAEAFTTPPHASPHTEAEATPDKLGIATPGTPHLAHPGAEAKVGISGKGSMDSPRQSDGEPISPSVDLLPRLLEPGLTGADLTLPIFDGLSKDPTDYLIDLETDSMEKYPDVRRYFWMVGHRMRIGAPGFYQQDEPETFNSGSLERAEQNERLVKEGREYIRQARIRGDGFYLNSSRDILAKNHPASPWYRLPTIGVAKTLCRGVVPFEDEGNFVNGRVFGYSIGSVLLTNIRVPVLWTPMFKDGIVPGTRGWYQMIGTQYISGQHPVHRMSLGSSRSDVIATLIYHLAYEDPEYPCDPDLGAAILDETWPDLVLEAMGDAGEATEEMEPEDRARLYKHMRNMGEFFKGKKRYRRKRTFLGITFG